MGDNPVPTFTKGRVCISGDAAHATAPHHGAGAGLCIEDSYVLAELFADPSVRGPGDLAAALAAFDENRRERGQWLVQSSRRIGDTYEWQASGIGSDVALVEKEIIERNGIIADYDIQGGALEARRSLERNLGLTGPVAAQL